MTAIPRPRRTVAWIGAVAILGVVPALVLQGSSVSAENTSNGSYGGSSKVQPASPGKALVADVKSVSAIAPGRDGLITVTVKNPNNQDVLVTALRGSVQRTTSGNLGAIPKCDPSWIVLGQLSAPTKVLAKKATDLTIPVRFDDKPDVNQDNCKGVTYTFSVTVNGQQA